MVSKRSAHSFIFFRSFEICSSVCCHVVESSWADNLRCKILGYARIDRHAKWLCCSVVLLLVNLQAAPNKTTCIVFGVQQDLYCSWSSMKPIHHSICVDIQTQGAWVLNFARAVAKMEIDAKLGGGTAFSNICSKSLSPCRSINLRSSILI